MKYKAQPITSRSRFQPADSPAKYNSDLVQGAAAMHSAGGVEPVVAADPADAEEPIKPATKKKEEEDGGDTEATQELGRKAKKNLLKTIGYNNLIP